MRPTVLCVLISLVLASISFLCVQFILLYYSKNSEDVNLPVRLARSQPRNNQHASIAKFTDVARELGVHVFLIDPVVLKVILRLRREGARLAKTCGYLCNNSTVTTFGILSHADISVKFLEQIQESGFKVFTWYGEDTRSFDINLQQNFKSEITLHYLFVLRNHGIHLVVFYLRGESFMWHGKLEVSNRANSSPGEGIMSGVTFGVKSAGAYDMMEFAEIRVDSIDLLVPKYPATFLAQIPNSTFLECNIQHARDFFTRYGIETDVKYREFQIKAAEILRVAVPVLDDLGLPFWLSSGTCLGWFRQCGIIGHSLDVDLGMRITDYSVRLIPAMEAAGLLLVHQFGKKSDSFELSFVYEDLKLDIFFFYEEDSYVWNGGTDTSNGNKYKYIFPKFTLCWTQFINLKVRVPCETLSYIEANYGKTWNQKVTEWDWKSSPPNVRANGQWGKSEWAEVMQMYDIILEG